MIHILPHFQKHNRLLSTNMTAHLWTVSRWHASPGYRTNSQREKQTLWLNGCLPRPTTFIRCPLSAIDPCVFLSQAPNFYFYHSFVWAYSRAALISAFLPPRPNLASCFGLDELVAQWTKPVCLLHKPMFQAYTLWQLYRALQKKKVNLAAVWIKKWVGGKKKKKLERIILALFRACCSWPGFCKALKAQDIKRCSGLSESI